MTVPLTDPVPRTYTEGMKRQNLYAGFFYYATRDTGRDWRRLRV